MPQYTIRISAPALEQVRRHLSDNHKIQAIKYARSNGKQCPPRMSERHNKAKNEMEEFEDYSVGLRNAKHAVEVLSGQIQANASDAVFTPMLKIVSFRVQTGDGVVEVDVDELRLRLLDGMSEMSLAEMSHMTELAAYIANWQNLKQGIDS